MLKIEYLTPLDQELFDPSGRIRSKLKAEMNERRWYNTPCPLFSRQLPNDWLHHWEQRLAAAITGKAHSAYLEWNSTFKEKYLPQGGHYPWSILENSVKEYYSLADSIKPRFNYVKIGRDYLLRFIRQWVSKNGYPQVRPCFVTGTYAGVPTGSKKGQFDAETIGHRFYNHVWPSIAGQRILAGKDRVIYQDSVINVRSVEAQLTTIRDWARTVLPEFFGAWLNPSISVSPTLTRPVMRSWWFEETDYEAMDKHFTQDFFREIVLPLWCELLPPGERIVFQMHMEEVFTQPLYFGQYLWTGLHTLFSGQGITNDSETWGQVCQAIGCLLVMHLNPHEVPQVHIGDDQSVAFENEFQVRKYHDLFSEESTLNGLVLNDKKTISRKGCTTFCKKLYYPAGPKDDNGNLLGAYSSIRCLNSMVRPESNADSLGVLACATWQRLDNCVGSPDHRLLTEFVSSQTELKAIPITDEAIDRYATRDWWNRLYGESWNPAASPSFRIAGTIS